MRAQDAFNGSRLVKVVHISHSTRQGQGPHLSALEKKMMMELHTGGGRDPCHPSGAIGAHVHGPGCFRSGDAQSDWLAGHLHSQARPNYPVVFLEDRGAVDCFRSDRSGTERLWKQYFTDPSQWWDNRNIKANPKSPHFKDKITKEALWVDGWHNPDWVKVMPEKRVQPQDLALVEKCGNRFEVNVKASKAQEVREKSSWETPIVEEALTSMEQMSQQPSVQNLTWILHKCRALKNDAYTKRFYAYLCKNRLEDHRSLGNYLVPMLVQIGSMCDAQQVFNKLADRNLYSWNSLISGYMKCGESHHALNLYQKMREDFVHPDTYTFVAVLKACVTLKDAERGREIHTEIARKGLERDLFVGSTLVDMYAKCGLLAEAREAIVKLPVRDEVSWTALMTGYAEHGLGEEALNCFELMRLEGLSPNAVTFSCSLKACGSIGGTDTGQEIHAEIARKGLDKHLVVGSALVDMYAKCGMLAEAREAFDKLPVRDVVSWTAIMAGYAENGLGEEALNCLKQMQLEGLSPNAITFVCSLKACGNIEDIDKGRKIHTEIAKRGLGKHLVVGSALVDMYARCGSLAEARQAFDKLLFRDKASWNALMAGYAEYGLGEEALSCLEQMKLEGLSPDAVTFVCSLKACSSIGAIDKGREIHTTIAREELERNPFVGNTLVDMYAKCGALVEAREVFYKLLSRNEVSWNALMTGFAEHGLGEEILNCLEQMKLEGCSPDAVTFVCGLKACGGIGAIDKGRDIHAEIISKGLERHLVLGNTVVDMYAKSSALADATDVFDKLPVRNVVSWGALMAGYAQLGENETVFDMLERMRGEEVRPDGVTFSIVLIVCSHTGLVNKGQEYFEAMRKDYGITPTIEHHTCMVDLLGRAGQLDEAVAMVKNMPFHPNNVVWLTVLGACQKWGNVKLGRLAFEHAVQLDGKNAAAYILMSNIYSDANMQEEEEKIEAMRVKEQAWKKPGQSWWTDISGIVHSFLVGEMRHFQSEKIYARLQDLSVKMREKGYVPALHWVSLDITIDPKEDGLCGHIEKLAIACALINTSKGTPIRVFKNLRVCKECHAATALISEIEQRTILVRDANRFHIFKQGKCACRDYW